VISGDCTTALGTVAGLQHAGMDQRLVWFDPHRDVQALETTASGYLGGLPLRVGSFGQFVTSGVAAVFGPLTRLARPRLHIDGGSPRRRAARVLDVRSLRPRPNLLHLREGGLRCAGGCG
jgi:arginase family enzyme